MSSPIPNALAWGDRLANPAIDQIVVPRASAVGYEPALAIATELGLRHSLPVHVVSVVTGDSVDLADPGRDIKAAHPEVTLTAEVLHAEDDPIATLATALRSSDLVVMATDAGGEDGTSFAQDLTHEWGGPVMMLGPACPKEALGTGSVTVALDGSAFAERALPYAHELATLFEAPLALVEVVSSAVSRQVQTLAERGERVSESAYVDDLTGLLGEADVQASWTVVHDDDPVHGLTSYLADHNVSILVMASHGHGGLPRPAFGSTCLETVRNAKVPVVALRPTAVATRSIDLTGGD